jgi:succinyl-diaminopimelate desuccinylase
VPDLAARLAARTLALVDAASESRAEERLAAQVLELLRAGGVPARDAGDTCVLAGAAVESRGEGPLVLLAGHLDTVPAQGNRPGRHEDGVVHGLGAADMKGGVAVMLELALAGVDFGYVLFGREELPFSESALTPLLAREPVLRQAVLAIVLEPTANAIHAGCLGNVSATWTFRGRSGHSARPWLADNAIHRAGHGIAALADLEPVVHEVDGLRFTEVVSVTTVQGGIARNVVPDRCTAHVNYRYPPGKGPEEAEAWLHERCAPHGELQIEANAPSGPVAAGHPLVQALRATGDLAVEPKQAWTPVAELAAAGVPAVNLGPGDPRFAHRRDEQVDVAALVRCHAVLEAFAAR